ncbi:hypothetical protein [Ruegeria sp. Ofav3-42]|uniref:hypothetical protein n=1 Tax=Ruegeria sp. Ofav3-42 TaxID=2917759 RepID=UPI001EF729A6|nr:hypothetical protein [Ruegeria sp. Ofav3-42]MCG7521608.1 hypothetical protein [Ruegeria sp. Ofav3-42]
MADAYKMLRAFEPKATRVLAKLAAKGDKRAINRLRRAYPDSADDLIAEAKDNDKNLTQGGSV